MRLASLKSVLGFGPSGAARPLGIIQVEVTTRCNHRCQTCPCAEPSADSHHADLDWDVYRKLAESFQQVGLVYLQGWGEPLLHPRLFDMIDLAKSHGCKVGFTTNGSLLTPEVSARILEAGLDYLVVSFAGADEYTHNTIRRGSDFDQLTGNIKRLVRLKRAGGHSGPAVHLSYLVTADSLPDLSRAVELAAGLGVDRLVTPNLDCPVNEHDEERKAFGWNPPSSFRRYMIEVAEKRAKRLKVKFRPPNLELSEETLVCELNPVNQLFVNVRGEVSPCVFASLAGQSRVERYFGGRRVSLDPLVFGTIGAQGLGEIWNTQAYRAFRQCYARRVETYQRVARTVVATAVEGHTGVGDIACRIEQVYHDHPLPEFCRTCYKAYGA